MSEENQYKPVGLVLTRDEESPSPLTPPYNLTLTILNQISFVRPAGIDSTQFGTAKLIPTQILKVVGFTASIFGTAQLKNKNQTSGVTGFNASLYGRPTTYNSHQYLRFGGMHTAVFGTAQLKNKNQTSGAAGFNASLYGRPTIYNLRQYLRFGGMHTAVFGTAYMQGGVKYVRATGFNVLAFPTPKVINTRADQYVDLRSPSRGIAPPTIDRPNVSPRILYPMGILPGAFGTAWVQRNPSPKGFTTDSYGNAWVSHSPRYLTPFKVEAFLSGYAKVFDPTQTIYHADSPHIPGGIFGDTAIKNSRRIVSVLGEDQARYGDWTNLYSNLTEVTAQSFDAQGLGQLNIWNKTPSVIPSAWDSAEFGTTFISDRVRRILGRGIEMAESQRFGKHVLTKPPEIEPNAINAQVFGQTWISNKRRHLEVNGFNAQRFDGEPVVWFRYRHVNATGVNFATVPPPKVEHAVRNLLVKGAAFNVFGTPTTWFKVRSVAPPSIYRDFETKHLVGGTQHILAQGFVATEFGTRIIPEIQSVYGLGFNTLSFSEQHQIELHTRHVRLQGFVSYGNQNFGRFGVAKFWNKRQYVQHNYDSGDGLNPGEFGRWTTVTNRNREIKAIGFTATKYGYTQIDNNARPLLPSAFATEVFGRAMIADRIRRLRLEGMEAPYMSGWGRVHNAAFVIAPISGRHDQWGVASLVNTRREYRWVGAFESLQFGQPMVAFRIRTLSLESRYAIYQPQMPLPKVELHTRYIEPIGPELEAFGGPSLYIKWNIITTRWTHRELFGEPAVRNLTPELKQRGVNSEDFGKPSLRLQWEKYPIDGFGNQIFGRAHIADRDRTISIIGFNGLSIGQLKVTKTGAPPYSLQSITLDWGGEGERPEGFSGQGIGIPDGQVARPSLRTNVIFAESFVATKFGSQHLQSNGILVEPGIQEFAIGDHFVGLKNRTIEVPTMGDFAQIESTRPRLNPHTIYAVMESPEQARRNHPISRQLHYVNSDSGTRAAGEVFGRTVLSLRHRRLNLGGNTHTLHGRPTVALKKNYIKPTGIQSFRMGWHFALDGSPQYVEQYDSTNHALYGRPTVTSPYYGPQTVRVGGLSAVAFGANRIEHFHREVKANGFQATQMGASRGGDTAYKPQSLWVGRPMPTIPEGFESERFGTTWVSNKVRDVGAEGFESFTSEMDISNFKVRMKVELVKKAEPISPNIVELQSIGSTMYGVPNIKLKIQYIRPDGFAEQYRKGGPNVS